MDLEQNSDNTTNDFDEMHEEVNQELNETTTWSQFASKSFLLCVIFWH